MCPYIAMCWYIHKYWIYVFLLVARVNQALRSSEQTCCGSSLESPISIQCNSHNIYVLYHMHGKALLLQLVISKSPAKEYEAHYLAFLSIHTHTQTKQYTHMHVHKTHMLNSHLHVCM